MNKLSFLLVLAGIAVVVTEEHDANSAEQTFQFLYDAQSKLKLPNSSNIILVIGNTGSGKSTLIHYLAGDNSKLISLESPNPNVIDFIISDQLDPGRDSQFATVSRTLIPEAYVDDEQNVFCDTPGFGDTRNETVEIAATFLIKSVIKSALNIKVVMVVNYDSVAGYNRDDFDNLLSRTSQLIKNVKKFKDSVSLVVTKAPSIRVRGRTVIDIHEDSVKNSTAAFMAAHRMVLELRGSNENKISLIDALLENDSNDQDYPRISIFLRPTDVGPFDTIDRMVAGRLAIRKSILEHTTYAGIDDDDFGYPLTASALLKVNNLVQHISDVSRSTLTNIADEIIGELLDRIDRAVGYERKFEMIKVAKTCVQLEHQDALSLKQLTEKLTELILSFNITSIDLLEFDRLEQHVKNLIILEPLLHNPTTNNSTTNPFLEESKRTSNYFPFLLPIIDLLADYETEILFYIAEEAEYTIGSISSVLTQIDDRLLMELIDRYNANDDFIRRLELFENGQTFIQTSKKSESVTLTQWIALLTDLIRVYQMESVDMSEFDNVRRLERYFNTLMSVAKTKIALPVRDMIANSSKFVSYQSQNYDWYLLLKRIFDHLTGYVVQKDVTAYNVEQLSDGGHLDNELNIIVDADNFDEFLAEFSGVSQFISTPSKLAEINKILNVTLNAPPQYHCAGDTMTIQGYVVKSSDIDLQNCETRLHKINVYAVHTFFVNCDLHLNDIDGIELKIFAHTWNVIQAARFDLSGNNGTSHTRPESGGMAGKPGNVGENGGHFYGLAYQIINGHSLTVTVNGGNGGNGQDGTTNEDVTVAFEEHSHSMTDVGWVNTDQYFLGYLTSWGYKVEKIKLNSYFKYFAVLAIGRSEYANYRMFAKECCGVTGTGGSGKYSTTIR